MLKSGWVLLSPRICLYAPAPQTRHSPPSGHCWQPVFPDYMTHPGQRLHISSPHHRPPTAVAIRIGCPDRSSLQNHLFRQAAMGPVCPRAPRTAERNLKKQRRKALGYSSFLWEREVGKEEKNPKRWKAVSGLSLKLYSCPISHMLIIFLFLLSNLIWKKYDLKNIYSYIANGIMFLCPSFYSSYRVLLTFPIIMTTNIILSSLGELKMSQKVGGHVYVFCISVYTLHNGSAQEALTTH